MQKAFTVKDYSFFTKKISMILYFSKKGLLEFDIQSAIEIKSLNLMILSQENICSYNEITA